MPLYQIRGLDGKIYQINGPPGVTKEQIKAKILERAPQAGVPPQEKSAIEEIPIVGGFLGQVADYPAKLVEGLAGVSKAGVDAFGASSGVSDFLGNVAKGARSLRSEESREGEMARAIRSQLAEKKGIGAQVGAAARNFFEAPLESTAEVAGSAVPFIAAGALTGGAAVPVGLGALVGAGTVKGAIYEATYDEFKKAGADEEKAAAAAEKAQEYGGENIDQIGLGAVLGGLASSVGFEPAIARTLGRRAAERVAANVAAREAAEAAGTEIARKSVRRGVAAGIVKEAAPEALQGGQERYASNVALQRQGFDVDPFEGVAGQAAAEGIASIALGGYGGARETNLENTRTTEQQYAEKVAALPDNPTEEDVGPIAEWAVSRGFNEEEARGIARNTAAYKARIAKAQAEREEARRQGMEERTAGVEPSPEPDINAPGMPGAEQEFAPPPVDPEEQAAMQQAYADEVEVTPFTPTPAPTPTPAAPTGITPNQAEALIRRIEVEPDLQTDIEAATGLTLDDLYGIADSETGPRYSRRGPRGKDTQTASLGFDLPVQEAPGKALQRDEFNAQRFASEEEKAARQEQALQEARANQERAVALQQREAEQREETLGDIEYALRAQAPENAAYKVVYDPTSNSAPYRLVAETQLGKKPEDVISATTLQDFSDQVYGRMMELTPYIPETAFAVDTVEQIKPSEQEAPTAATRMVQAFTTEVDAAREAGQIDNNQRSQLLGRLERPNAYRTLPNGRQVANDAIAKLEEEALAAASVATNAPANEKKAATAASKEANDRLRAAVSNSLLNPARAALKTMVEQRVSAKRNAGIRTTEAQLQQNLGTGALKRPTEVAEELQDAPEKLATAELQANLSDVAIVKAQRVLDKAKQRKKRDLFMERKLQDAIDKAEKRLAVAEAQIGREVERTDRLEAATEEQKRLKRGVNEEITKERDAKIDLKEAKVQKYRRAPVKQGIEASAVQRVVDKITATWKSKNPVVVVQSIDDIPSARVRRAIKRDKATNAEGLVAPDGTIYLIADNLADEARAKAVLFHEGLGHVGLEKLFRGELDGVLTSLYNSNAKLKADTDRWVAENPDAYASDTDPLARAIEEVLAERSETGKIELPLLNRIAALVRNFARRLGIQLAFSNADVEAVLAAAHERTVDGANESQLVKGVRYMSAKAKTSKPDAKKLDESNERLSEGARKVNKSFSTQGMLDGLEEMTAGHSFKDWSGALWSNWNLFSPAKQKAFLKIMPSSGILGWVKPDFPMLHEKMEAIDEQVQLMNALKQRILAASDKLAIQLQDFVDKHGVKTLANLQAMARINEVDPYEFASMVEALQKNAVIVEIERRLLANTNNAAQARTLIDEIKDIVVQNKDSVKVEGDKYKMSKTLEQKVKQLQKLAVDAHPTMDQVRQLSEMTRRVRDTMRAREALDKQKGGREAYIETRSFYKDMFEAELALLDARIDQIADEEEAIRIKDMRAKLMREIVAPDERKKQGDVFWDIDADLFQKDYFPFMREGDLWLRVAGTKDGTREREFYTFRTPHELREAQKKVAARLGVDPEENDGVIEIGYDIGDLQQHLRTEDELMQRVFDTVGKARETYARTNSVDLKELTDSIYQTWLMTTPERSVRRRLMHSEEVVGFSQDVFLHFRQQATTYANQLSKLTYAGRIRLAVEEARDLINDPERKVTEKAKWNNFVREFEARAEQEINPDPQNALVNLLSRSSYFYYLTSAKTALLQLTSVPIRVVPRLWRDYGFAEGTAMWLKYMKMWNSLGRVKMEKGRSRFGDYLDALMPSVNGSQFVSSSDDLRWAKKMGMERGILETLGDTLVQNERATPSRTSTGTRRKVENTIANTGKVMSFMFNGMENISRQASYYMTFELAAKKYRKENPGATDAATRAYAFKQAVSMVRQTLGDYSAWERPSLAKGNLGRSVFLFKMHPITQTRFMVGAMRDIFTNAGGERAGAMKEFTGVLMMAGMFGGVMGMPLYSAMTYALMAAFGPDGDDDDDVRALMGGDPRTAYDPDIAFRSWMNETFGSIKLGDTPLAEVLVSGPISAATNTELASSTSLDLKNMWFRDPVVGDNLEDTLTATAIANIAGLSMAAQVLRGSESLAEGNIRDGLKKMLPAFFRAGANAYYNETDGVKNRRGDILIPKEDISAADNFRDALGFRTPKLSQIQQYYITRAKREEAIKKERDSILDDFERSWRDGEIKTREDLNAFLKEEIVPFNRTYPDPAFIISEETLQESLERRAGIRARTVEGMQLGKKTAGKDLAAQRRFVQ